MSVQCIIFKRAYKHLGAHESFSTCQIPIKNNKFDPFTKAIKTPNTENMGEKHYESHWGEQSHFRVLYHQCIVKGSESLKQFTR